MFTASILAPGHDIFANPSGEFLFFITSLRLVALACHPFTIVHANAAFLRLSGLPYERIVGSGFSSIVDRSKSDQDSKPILLPHCLESSSSGDHLKLQLVREDEAKEPVERWAKVLPIVDRRPLHCSGVVAHVTHFAVDIVEERDLGNDVTDNLSNIKVPSPDHAQDVAVEVMG